MESDQSLTDGRDAVEESSVERNCSKQLNSIARPCYGASCKMVRLEKENVAEGYDNANHTMAFIESVINGEKSRRCRVRDVLIILKPNDFGYGNSRSYTNDSETVEIIEY